MTQAHTCNDAAFVTKVEGFRALPQLLRLLARGEPVRLTELAAAAGQAGADLARTLLAQPGTEWDDAGRVVGFGLTLRPTPYRYRIGGKALYTWCSSDTLLFTIVLGADAVAESTCPTTGVPIRVEMRPDAIVSVTPPEAVVSQRFRTELVDNLRAEMCDHGHFFASTSASSAWSSEYPEGRVLSVSAAFDEYRTECGELGWIAPGVATSPSS